MTRRFLEVFAAASLVLSCSASAAEKHVRDLAPATAESVGMSTERLSRLDAAMKRLVDASPAAMVLLPAAFSALGVCALGGARLVSAKLTFASPAFAVTL